MRSAGAEPPATHPGRVTRSRAGLPLKQTPFVWSRRVDVDVQIDVVTLQLELECLELLHLRIELDRFILELLGARLEALLVALQLRQRALVLEAIPLGVPFRLTLRLSVTQRLLLRGERLLSRRACLLFRRECLLFRRVR